MAWSVVGTNHNAGNTSISLAMPTGTASGDTILLFIHHESASTAAPTPTGYTLIGDKLNTTQALRVTAFSKVAGASEPAVTCVGGTGWSWQEPALIVVRGGAASAPVDLSSNNQGTGTATSAPTITTTAADMLVAFFTNWNGGESFTTPTGFTAQLSDSADGLYLFSEAQSAAGATGAVSSTLSASDSWVSWLVAVLPAGGGGTVSSGAVDMGNVDGGLAPLTAIVAAVADVTPLGGAGALAILSLVGATPVGALGGGLAPQTDIVAQIAGATSLGGSGALDSGMLVGGSGGLSATATMLIGSGVVTLGGSGGLTSTATVIHSSGLVTLGGSGSLIPFASELIASGVVSLGNAGSGAQMTGTAVRFATQTALGGGAGMSATATLLIGSGIVTLGGGGQLFANIATLLSGPVTLGGSGSLSATGGELLTSGRVTFGPRLPVGGLLPFVGAVGEPQGNWVLVAPNTWRAAAGPGWVATPIYVWRRGYGSNLLTPNQASIETDLTGFSTAADSLVTVGDGIITRDTSISLFGSASLRLDIPSSGSGSGGVEIKPGVAIPAGTLVTISLYYYSLVTGGGAVRLWDFTNGNAPNGGANLANPTGGVWVRFTLTYTQTLATSDLRFCVRSSSRPQTMWLDGLQLEFAPAATQFNTGSGWKALTT